MKAPSSFDTIGKIIILPEKTKNPKKVAHLLLKEIKNIETIVIKTGIHKGKYRLQKTKHLAGKKTKTTLHKENNCLLKLNIDTCYFSPRLSSERLRISKLIKKNESVLVLFSGVSPFPCVISKSSKPKEIYAVELNPSCHKFAQENIQLNKLDNIKLFKGDVKLILPKIKKKFNRIIMPLPRNAESFLDIALKKSKKGTVIHFYDFQLEKDIPKKTLEKIKHHIKKFKVLKVTKCGQYSPRKFRICIDLKI